RANLVTGGNPNVVARVNEHEPWNAGQMAEDVRHSLHHWLAETVQARSSPGPDRPFPIHEHFDDRPVSHIGVRDRLDTALLQPCAAMVTGADPERPGGVFRQTVFDVAEGHPRRGRTDHRRG